MTDEPDRIAAIRERHKGGDYNPAYHFDIRDLLAEVDRLREALSWYADKDNYGWFGPGGRPTGDEPIMWDTGKRARAALAGKEVP